MKKSLVGDNLARNGVGGLQEVRYAAYICAAGRYCGHIWDKTMSDIMVTTGLIVRENVLRLQDKETLGL